MFRKIRRTLKYINNTEKKKHSIDDAYQPVRLTQDDTGHMRAKQLTVIKIEVSIGGEKDSK